ncbi:glycosyltransferase family 39 protein [Gimesia sp.]|uniref:ArnT family glycosyltransferase n=1 Tax=Gimesia sp. TaxID=2024833 RepID=UPI0032ED1C85
MSSKPALSKNTVVGLLLIWGTPLLLAGLILQQTAAFRNSKSATFDETYYLSTALKTVHQGFLDTRISGEGVAPLPIILDYLPVVWNEEGSLRENPWEGEVSDPVLIRRARGLNSILVGIPTMLVVYCWLYRRRGYLAALLGGALVTFSPTMEAHFSLATTDACFTLMALIALATLVRYWKQPGAWNLFWVALAVSVAISAKYSGILLLPCTLLIVSLVALQKWTSFSKAAVWSLAKRVTLVFGVFLLMFVPLTWALHLFSFTGPLKNVPYAETPDYSPWVKMLGRGPTAQKIMEIAHNDIKRPAPFAGVLFQFQHNEAGHDAYLMGELSKSGWWYFFPLAWLWKSTPVELLLTVISLCLLLFLWGDLKRLVRPVPAPVSELPVEEEQQTDVNAPTSHAPLIWVLAVVVFMGMSLTSRLNLGQRYLLLLYPLLFLFSIDQMWRWFEGRLGLLMAVSVALIGFQVQSIVSVQPNYLSYFNDGIGGPQAGHKYLLDSNLDWGQDLPALKKIMDELPLEDQKNSLIYYFGTARPDVFGIKAAPLHANLDADPDQWKYMIISANHLQGLYAHEEDPCAEFRKLEPFKMANYSIYVFDLQSPEAKQALKHCLKIYQKYEDEQQEK